MLFLTRLFGVTRNDAERCLDEEQDFAEEIVGCVLRMQSDAAARQGRALCRGTHAKGICARATLEVFDVSAARDPVLAGRLANGMFQRPGTYPATVRFANSDPQANSDLKRDVRSLSFSVALTPDGGERQDFSMQSAPILPLNDARAFLATMKVLTARRPLRAMLSLRLGDQLRVVRAIGLAELQTRQAVRPYQQLRYWSTVPFRHGAADIVKQSATPFPGNHAHALERGNPNALQDELVRHLEQDEAMSSFDIAVQFLDPDRMTYWGRRQDASFWIENASVKWKEEEAPFHTVARLTLLPNSHLGFEAGERVYFDVTRNAMLDSVPVGSINRARWRSEAASREERARASAGRGAPEVCPRS